MFMKKSFIICVLLFPFVLCSACSVDKNENVETSINNVGATEATTEETTEETLSEEEQAIQNVLKQYECFGSVEYKKMEINEQRKALDCDKDILKTISTENLIDLAFKYPLKSEYKTYDTYAQGFRAMASRSAVYSELLEREDFLPTVKDMYDTIVYNIDNNVQIDYKDYGKKEFCFDLMGAFYSYNEMCEFGYYEKDDEIVD